MRLTLLLGLIIASSSVHATIRSYFNGRSAQSYVDPYRGVTRQGDDLEAVILAELSLARKTVFIAVQEIRLPRIAQLLVAKYKAGVDVRIVLENNYNHNILAQANTPEEGETDTHDATRFRDLVKLIDVNGDGQVTRAEMSERDAIFILQQAKIPLIDDTEDGSSGSGLMHHKFVVIDGKRVIISSANFTPSCIHGDVGVPASRGNANGIMVVESAPMAKIFNEEFSFLWEGKFGMNKPFRGARTVTVGGKKFTVQFSPSSRGVAWDMSSNGLISKTLSSAKKSIEAALFVFSEQKLADAMKVASTKASVSVLVEPKFAFRSYSELLDLLGVTLANDDCVVEAGNAPWRPNSAQGGQPILPGGDVLHHKFAVVDSRKVIFGSHNWSDAANVTNDEFLVVVDDSATASDFSAEFTRISGRARWGLPERVRREIETMSQRCTSL
jgi:phosphatidylserine/phosphatidylglycerophosphate/cardiolipin synthase-like enzyme